MIVRQRAQTATEYLVILAVVIVIALIVVSVLGGIPGIGQNGQSKAEQIFWSTAELALPAYANGETSGLSITFRNNLRESVTVYSFSLDGVDILDAPSGVLVESGDQIALPLNQSQAPSCNAVERFSYSVEINYTTEITGVGYTYTGVGHKLSGTCAN